MSRQNLSPNPACGSNVTGWGGGSTPTRVTGLGGLPVTTGAHYSANSFAQTPTGAASAGVTYTASMYVNNNAGVAFNGKTLYFAFTRSSGGDDFSQTTTVNIPTGVSRISFTGVAPANATGLYLILDTFNATLGSGVDLTACLLEASGSLGTYFDGNTAGASWDGTPDNSTSTLTSAKISTLTDNFTTQNNTLWTYSGSASVSTGQLNLIPATSYGNKIDSITKYDLTSSAISVQLVTAPVGNGGIDTYVKLYDVSGDEVDFQVQNNILYMTETISSTPSSTNIAYNSSTHAWLRIRHDGTNLLWETSSDALTWTTRRTKTPGRAWTSVTVQLLAGYFGTEPTPGVSVLDNVNLSIIPTGLAVAIGLGNPTVTLGITTAPSGLAVPVALGNPTVGATVASATQTGGSWWQLESVRRTNLQNAEMERRAGPIACPNDGEPLQFDPRTGKKRCPYDGWIQP